MNDRHRRSNWLWGGWGSSESGIAHVAARDEANVNTGLNGDLSEVRVK